MNIIKRFSSVLLIISMIASIVSMAVPAMAADSGLKAVYDIVGSFADKTDAEAVTYSDTNEFWEYYCKDATWGSVSIRRAYGFQASIGKNWFAIKIKVPAAGDYAVSMEHGKASSGCVGGVYIVPVGKTNKEITAMINSDDGSKLGEVDYYQATGLGKTTTTLKSYTFPTAGEYLVVYRYVSKSTANETTSDPNNMYPGKLTLDGGDNSALMSVRLNIADGKNATVSCYMSDGSTAVPAGARITYSSDNADVAKINSETGAITPVAIGTATIKASIDFDGKTSVASKLFEVTKAPLGCSGVRAEFNFIGISSKWLPNTNADQGMADATRKEDIRGITYEYTAENGNGNWQWYGVGPSWTPNHGAAWVYRGSDSLNGDFRLRLYMLKNDWAALTVKVAVAGRYIADVEYTSYSSSSGKSDIYIVPMTELENVNASLVSDNLIGTVDYLDASADKFKVAKKTLEYVEFEKPGEYLIVFKQLTGGYITPRKILLDGVNALRIVEFSVDDDTLDVGASSETSYTAKLLDGNEMAASELTIKYVSSDESIAAVDSNGKISGISEGTADITVIASDAVNTIEKTITVTVTDNSGIKSKTLVAPDELLIRDTAAIKLNIEMNSGNLITVSPSSISYELECEPEGAATISEDGILTAVKEGSVKVKVNTSFKGSQLSEEKTVSLLQGSTKTEPTYYTYEKRAAAHENTSKYKWAYDAAKAAGKEADLYVENIDFFYSSVIGEGIPRGRQIGAPNDPEFNLCRYCGADVVGKYGSAGVGGWEVNALSRPWKVKCPECQRVFPSNDFEDFYELGLDEHGIFDVNEAHRKNKELTDAGEAGYLKNILYPETAEKFGDADWGVDDGFGYMPKNEDGSNVVYSNGVIARHGYIALYAYTHWGDINAAVTSLSNAYLYTGEIKYGRAGAILLDRIADVYPDMDANYFQKEFLNTSGGSGMGKIQGRIFDCNLAKSFALACDSFYPILDDSEVITYLNNKAQKYNLENDKSSALKIWNNWESGILEAIFNGCKSADIYGNYGMQQFALASAAVVLAKEPESREMIDWIFKTGGLSGHTCTGGNLNAQLVDIVDRDGWGTEGAVNYNNIWIDRLYLMADVLSAYNGGDGYDIYKNPKFAQMFMAKNPLLLTQSNHAQIGDSSYAASRELIGDINISLNGFAHLKDTALAKSLACDIYIRNGFKTDGLKYDIFTKNPESIQDEIEALVEETPDSISEMETGFGFSVLRDGKRYNSVSSTSRINNQRDFWLYFGRNTGHGHQDTLNLGIEAFGLNLAPDLGYPDNTGTNPKRLQWVSATLSHNTVFVDDRANINGIVHGYPKHFDDSGAVKVMDIDASQTYKNTSVYRRTVVMVKASDDVSYGVDFFRIVGGDRHVYSFHAQAENATAAEGLNLVAQEGGSYAGVDVPWGEDPDTIPAWSYQTKYPWGYTWLKNVRRDSQPSQKFGVEFEIKDYRKATWDSENIRLRMTMLNDFALDDVSIAAGPLPATSYNKVMPETFDYVLARREGNNLNTLFTTVYEPYKKTRYISAMDSVNVTTVDGTPDSADTVRAIKVTHTNGRVDYIVYATNNKITYNVGGVFDFRGAIGVYTLNAEGENIYRYVNDGDIIGNETGKEGAYSGKIVNFEKNLTLTNYIDVNLPEKAADNLAGKFIYIDNDGVQNAVYKIESAESLENGNLRLYTGPISAIRSYRNADDFSKGFVYNFKENDDFTIPLSYVDDYAPIFDAVNDISVSAGSMAEVKVNAESPLNLGLTYVGTTLPRGSNFDASTATLKWKPDSSQVGKNHIAISVVDTAGRESIVHFNIKVLGATTGGSGGGGGGGGEPEKPVEPIEPEIPSDKPVTQPVSGGFTDISGYDWAARTL